MSIESPVALADLNDPDVFVRGVPHETFAHWRRTDPVHLTAHPEDTATGRSPATTTSSPRAATGSCSRASAAACSCSRLDEEMLAQQNMLMLMMDPPRHTRYRLLVSRAFTPTHIRELERVHPHRTHRDRRRRHRAGRVRLRRRPRGRAAAAGDRRDHGRPAGGPAPDLRLVEPDDRQRGPGVRHEEGDAENAMTELFAYSHALVDERRANPREDILTALTQAEIEGDVLSELEIDLFFLLLAVAGNETTRNLTANGMHALFQHPDQLASSLDRPVAAWRPRIEEMLRYGRAGDALPPHRDRGHELGGKHDQRGRHGRALVHQRQPRRGALRRARSSSASTARRTSTSRSAAAARTSASAPTWPARRSASSSSRCSTGSPTSSSPATSHACAPTSSTASSTCPSPSSPACRSARRADRAAPTRFGWGSRCPDDAIPHRTR